MTERTITRYCYQCGEPVAAPVDNLARTVEEIKPVYCNNHAYLGGGPE